MSLYWCQYFFSYRRNISRRSSQNFQDQVTRVLVGTIVLTRYNNKTYRVDDIVWDKNPQHSFECSTTGQSMTFIEYYRQGFFVVLIALHVSVLRSLLLNIQIETDFCSLEMRRL